MKFARLTKGSVLTKINFGCINVFTNAGQPATQHPTSYAYVSLHILTLHCFTFQREVNSDFSSQQREFNCLLLVILCLLISVYLILLQCNAPPLFKIYRRWKKEDIKERKRKKYPNEKERLRYLLTAASHFQLCFLFDTPFLSFPTGIALLFYVSF